MRVLLRAGSLRFQVLIGLLLTVGIAAAAAGEPPRTYCIRDAHIIPAPGQEIAPGSVLIRDYWDHQAEIDDEIQREWRQAEDEAVNQQLPPVATRLIASRSRVS